MLRFIRKKLRKALYVQIWEHRLKVSVFNSIEFFDEKPLVAIETSQSGKKIIKAIGNNAEALASENVSVVNPFSHPRVLFNDFQAGEKVFQHVFHLLQGKAIFRPLLIVVLQPMEKLEGGMTMIEKRAFREAAMGAGASEVYMHFGSPLSIMNFDLGDVTKYESI